MTDQELSDKKDELKSFIYDLITPVDSVFHKIRTFQDAPACILTENIKSDRRLVLPVLVPVPVLASLIFNITNTKAVMDSPEVEFQTCR